MFDVFGKDQGEEDTICQFKIIVTGSSGMSVFVPISYSQAAGRNCLVERWAYDYCILVDPS